jgi:hypothetical protein
MAEYTPVKKVVAEENFCCGYKRCPVVKIYEDGSALMEDDGNRIEFTPEQLMRLRELLTK